MLIKKFVVSFCLFNCLHVPIVVKKCVGKKFKNKKTIMRIEKPINNVDLKSHFFNLQSLCITLRLSKH
jgi:hypothetical protein